MEMEVVVPVVPSSSHSHYLSAPSTPFAAAAAFSAPTSPASCSSSNFLFCHAADDDEDVPIGSPSAVPFRWEERPGIPKASSATQDFEFDFGGHFFTKPSLSADELFVAGQIKPLQPPPGFQSNLSSPRSPHNSKLSPRKSKNDIDIDNDPFEAALMKETRSHSSNYELKLDNQHNNRGRKSDTISYFARKPTRSLSPFRFSSEIALNGDGDNSAAAAAGKSKASSFLSAISFSKANRKWRLRDLLFRSASEGRATEKADHMRTTYVVMPKKMDDNVKISSFRSDDGGGSRLHFTASNRAVSEELRKKNFLPNKPGLLGRCLRFNRSGVQEISKGIGSLPHG